VTISDYIALVRDAFIVIALGFVLWYVHRADQNAVKVADFQAVQKQIDQNTATEALWAKRFQDAEAQRYQDMQTVASAISAQHSPVIMRVPTSTGPVSSTPPSTQDSPSCPGRDVPQAGSNIRPAINAYELELEGYLGQCRALLSAWPR